MSPPQDLRRWVLSSRSEQPPLSPSSLEVADPDLSVLPRKELAEINLSGILAADPFWRSHCERHPLRLPSSSGEFKQTEPDLYVMALDRFHSGVWTDSDPELLHWILSLPDPPLNHVPCTRSPQADFLRRRRSASVGGSRLFWLKGHLDVIPKNLD